ncbi:hypothetical protein OH76DRAFT_1355594 [Lentinus brumalis]|uniref:Uncharacterized protein n=1 Tax=Lentinus brumalis TaxID=2498619 RepID=A0A371D2H0_9APHY|nr:hypothetical protein OH76DRAFT_1355594 [Polyporus brumalis]
MSGLLDRSLRGLRIRSSRASVASISQVPGSPVISPSASTTLLAGVSPLESVYDPTPPTRRTSIFRPKSPMFSSLPGPIIQPQPTIPEVAMPTTVPGGGPALSSAARTAHVSPMWPGLGPLHHAPDMPSPALTEGSSMHAPEGLLDPILGMRHTQGMQSQGALSFRDDMDYSRPIGGWVNNRQFSRTTIQTMSTMNSQHSDRTAHGHFDSADLDLPFSTPAEEFPPSAASDVPPTPQHEQPTTTGMTYPPTSPHP